MAWKNERARVAALTRSRADDDPELVEARRALRAARAEEYLGQLLSSHPQLTAEQRDHLAQLLVPVTMTSPDVDGVSA